MVDVIKPDAFKELQAKYPKHDYINDLKVFGKLSENSKERQADKVALLHTLEEYRNKGLNQNEAIKQMVSDYTQRTIEPRPDIHQRVKAISRASLLRWRKQIKEHGWSILAGCYRKGNKGYFDRHPEAMERLLSLRKAFPEASIADIFRAFSNEMNGKPHPSLRRITDVLRKHRV